MQVIRAVASCAARVREAGERMRRGALRAWKGAVRGRDAIGLSVRTPWKARLIWPSIFSWSMQPCWSFCALHLPLLTLYARKHYYVVRFNCFRGVVGCREKSPGFQGRKGVQIHELISYNSIGIKCSFGCRNSMRKLRVIGVYRILVFLMHRFIYFPVEKQSFEQTRI